MVKKAAYVIPLKDKRVKRRDNGGGGVEGKSEEEKALEREAVMAVLKGMLIKLLCSCFRKQLDNAAAHKQYCCYFWSSKQYLDNVAVNTYC